ncbi:hypothetical protein [Liquorilactobacillus capillatus]|uniref:Uncharacterized protein n=1 Tax=Liquorilactobacillus capillatus DSM 19910 TaxID=1423731 RepID=A0A0R1ME73_9LACO|nr:hypothetical protein [Liquorilactobacillus capillatus]KRL02499.1 hypothetical protein FC81_GL000664 [Liquorilactobacillus capillatus DSM 19910]
MTLENKILSSMSNYLASQEVTKKIENAVKKATDDVIEDLFTSYQSPVKEIIDKNLRSGLLKQMKNTDYSQSVVSLELLVRQVIKQASAENNNTLKRFKDWATFEPPEKVKTSEIFGRYLKFVEENIDTSELEVEFDDGPSFDGGVVNMEIESCDTSSKVKLTCEKDDSLDREFEIFNFNNTVWLREGSPSLRMVDEFEFWLRNIEANQVRIEIDETDAEEDVEVQEEPEPNY